MNKALHVDMYNLLFNKINGIYTQNSVMKQKIKHQIRLVKSDIIQKNTEKYSATSRKNISEVQFHLLGI